MFGIIMTVFFLLAMVLNFYLQRRLGEVSERLLECSSDIRKLSDTNAMKTAEVGVLQNKVYGLKSELRTKAYSEEAAHKLLELVLSERKTEGGEKSDFDVRDLFRLKADEDARPGLR